MYTALNNSSMKTVVETFVIEETQELIYDNEKLDQWNKHVEELGLKGQTIWYYDPVEMKYVK